MVMFICQVRLVMFYLYLTPASLARRTGMSLAKIERILSEHDCTFSDMKMILDGLDMSLDDLFSFVPRAAD